jgi:hypothetical protein
MPTSGADQHRCDASLVCDAPGCCASFFERNLNPARFPFIKQLVVDYSGKHQRLGTLGAMEPVKTIIPGDRHVCIQGSV